MNLKTRTTKQLYDDPIDSMVMVRHEEYSRNFYLNIPDLTAMRIYVPQYELFYIFMRTGKQSIWNIDWTRDFEKMDFSYNGLTEDEAMLVLKSLYRVGGQIAQLYFGVYWLEGKVAYTTHQHYFLIDYNGNKCKNEC